MRCRQCGTEIADKALICYKCGTATTEPTFKEARPKRSSARASLLISVLALAVLIVLILNLGRTSISGGSSRSLNLVLVVLAAAVVVLRAIARRWR